MMVFIATFLLGTLFALGLGVAGMTDANNVINFLDLSGTWDPSLGFVMVGAIAVHMLFYRFIVKRTSPYFGEKFHLPTNKDIDRPLIVGAIFFGAGWGLGGFCPGPALVSLATLAPDVLIFVGSMLTGMFLHTIWAKRSAA